MLIRVYIHTQARKRDETKRARAVTSNSGHWVASEGSAEKQEVSTLSICLRLSEQTEDSKSLRGRHAHLPFCLLLPVPDHIPFSTFQENVAVLFLSQFFFFTFVQSQNHSVLATERTQHHCDVPLRLLNSRRLPADPVNSAPLHSYCNIVRHEVSDDELSLD